MMDDLKLPDVSSQELERILTNISIPAEHLPLLRNTELEACSQIGADQLAQIGTNQLKYEEDTGCGVVYVDDNSATGQNPSSQDFPGPYCFSAELDNLRSNKAWLYSNMLDKVFVDVNKVIVMKFLVTSFIPGLYVRALPVYASCDFSQQPVNRCPNHSKIDDPDFKAHTEEGECRCSEYNLAGHVVRAHQQSAVYQYNVCSGRHSVVVPMPAPQPGCSYIAVPFSFACKTSCASGMQRRPVVIVFTLENQYCQVVGRKVVAVKICACPKRDMERMERDFCESGEDLPSSKQVAAVSLSHSRTDRATKRSKPRPLRDHSLSKKMKLVPVIVPSDADSSDYDVETVKRDLQDVASKLSDIISRFDRKITNKKKT